MSQKKNQNVRLLLPTVFLISVWSSTFSAVPAIPKKPDTLAELPLKKIVLYSNGVAYCERRGQVTGDVEIQLPFKKSQIADVLKSLVVIDRGGTVETVSYNLATPQKVKLAEVLFNIEAGAESQETPGGLYGVLRRLQGARISVQVGTQTQEGALLTVMRQTAQLSEKAPPVTTERLTLVGSDGTLRSFSLSEIRAVRLLDEGVRQDVNRFADIVAQARRQEVQTLVIAAAGKGSRELVVGYIVAAPIWKSNYRVVLDKSGKPFFQGWALIDNTSEEDWKEVSLALVSGSPVSFIHSIQYPLYRHRPVLPLPQDVSLTPQIVDDEMMENIQRAMADGNVGGVLGGSVGGAGEGGGFGGGIYRMAPGLALPGQPATSISDALVREEAGIKTAATGKEVGDMFEYRIEHPVSIARNHSALIPILQQSMEGGRISIFNAETQEERPSGGLLLKNTSPLTLEGGTLTVLEEDSYAGEAVLERLKPGEERLVGFSTDLATLIHREKKSANDAVCLVRGLKGFLELHYYAIQRTLYTIQNQTDRPRVLYLEHPMLKDWVLSPDGPQPLEKTGKVYRYRIELGPKEKTTLTVTQRLPKKDSYQLDNLTAENLELFVSGRYLDESQQQPLRQILDLKLQIANLKEQSDRAAREQTEITKDQERLRENIKTLQNKNEGRKLLARYISKADEQESRLETLEKQRQEAVASQEQLKQKMILLIKDFSMERKL
jgi:hypothetical protein